MDACGSDLICSVLSYFFDFVPSRYLPIIQIFFYPTLLGGTFWMGTLTGRGDKEEGFINGIMYYLNIQVYNDANIPYSIDENAERHVKEAKRRLGNKIQPRVPR